MKKIAILVGALSFLTAGSIYAQVPVKQVGTEKTVQQASKAKLEFDESSHDFGDITQGEKVSYTFKFKNTGEEPLILSNVLTTCGCTATNWPRNPIAPGATGEISATFNSAGKMGRQNKVITVISNAQNGNQRVSIVSNVKPKPAPAPTEN